MLIFDDRAQKLCGSRCSLFRKHISRRLAALSIVLFAAFSTGAKAQEITYVCRFDKHPVLFFGESIVRPGGSDTFTLMEDGLVQFGRHVMSGDVDEDGIRMFGAFDQPNKRGLLLKLKHTIFIDTVSGRYNRFSQITKQGKVIFNEIVEGTCKEA